MVRDKKRDNRCRNSSLKPFKKILARQRFSLTARFQRDYVNVEIPGASVLLQLKKKKKEEAGARSPITVLCCICGY